MTSPSTPKRAAILWTGGKDSALALYEAQIRKYDEVELVTFAPTGESFRAHPLSIMRFQADALGIPHSVVHIEEPFRQNYEKAIADLKKNGIDILVTGDISEVDSHPNWIRECSAPSGVEVLTPLWHADRASLMERLLSTGFTIIFSCVKKPWFTDDWIGKTIDEASLRDLRKLSTDTGADLCGENGEYHTITLDSPSFMKRLSLDSFSVRRQGSIMHLADAILSVHEKRRHGKFIQTE